MALLLLGLNISYANAGAFDTQRFDVEINWLEDNSFIVKENIRVNYNEPRHGLFRNILYAGTVVREINGKVTEERYKIKIFRYSCCGLPL